MNNQLTFEIALEGSLQMLAGGASLAQCLARYPQYANELAPLLEAAILARAGLGDSVPKPNLALGRARFLQSARPPRRDAAPVVLRLAFAAALMVALLTLGGVGLTYASAEALPGEALYPIKLTLARVELALTFDVDEREALQGQQAADRRREAQQAAALGREAQVSFEGVVEESRDGLIIVSGVEVNVEAVLADVRVGDRIQLNARIANGQITPEQITVLERPSPTPNAAEPTATLEPTRQATASPTQTPARATETPPGLTPTEQRPTLTPTGTRPVITRTPEIRPTQTLTETRPPEVRPTVSDRTGTPGGRP